MLIKLLYILRGIRIRIQNRGNISLPIHSRLAKDTRMYTSKGKIKIGYGFGTSTNTAFSALDGGEMIIGERVNVNRNCIFICRKKIVIGNHCTFGPNVCLYDHDHQYGIHGVEQGYKYGEIVIGDNCWIGAGVILLRGSHIGEGCVIGAGCLIKGDIPSHSLVIADKGIKIKEIGQE